MVILVLEFGAILFLQARPPQPGGHEAGTEGRTREQLADKPRHRSLHANEQGGFEFVLPKNWSLDETGTMSQLTAPRKNEVVTLARVPERTLSLAETRMIESMRSSYREVALAVRTTNDEGTVTSRRLEGKATNSKGLPMRFVAELRRQEKKIYVVLAFHPRSDSGRRLSPTARTVLRSFEPRSAA